MSVPGSKPGPSCEDYLALYALYGGAAEIAYREPASGEEDNRFTFLFNQVIRMMLTPSPFNAGMPESFLRTARSMKAAEVDVVRRMSDADNRHFFISDLHDYLQLSRINASRRKAM